MIIGTDEKPLLESLENIFFENIFPQMFLTQNWTIVGYPKKQKDFDFVRKFFKRSYQHEKHSWRSWGKKVSLFSKLNFCFAKSDLRVWEDTGIWEKKWSKRGTISWESSWNLFVFKTMILSRILTPIKTEERNWHLFRHTTRGCFLKVTIQQNLNMMCKIRENDGCLCRVKMLNFGSKTFRIFEFIPWIDLLASDIQHFRFGEFTWEFFF